ncbi:MAG TPA: (2Fe-2S)-binding protein [Nitrospinota bacterium]|jgi:NAD(P)H-nitrite reductase large subunit|nr:(2Fe-2S)-binding protein [Nitrospinota bacterium]|tara:strand:+ start:41161 stop:41373 length:213 start_codon:yes stop_codon:yes gene_type:complete
MHSKEEIIDGLRIACQCKAIQKKVFIKLIDDGIRKVTRLQITTGAGSGPCGGKRCTPKLKELLKSRAAKS